MQWAGQEEEIASGQSPSDTAAPPPPTRCMMTASGHTPHNRGLSELGLLVHPCRVSPITSCDFRLRFGEGWGEHVALGQMTLPLNFVPVRTSVRFGTARFCTNKFLCPLLNLVWLVLHGCLFLLQQPPARTANLVFQYYSPRVGPTTRRSDSPSPRFRTNWTPCHKR